MLKGAGGRLPASATSVTAAPAPSQPPRAGRHPGPRPCLSDRASDPPRRSRTGSRPPDDYFDAFKHHQAPHRAYGSKFFLNTRPVEHWVRSVMAHKAERFGRAALRNYELRFGTADLARVAACLRAEWDAHHRRVRQEIPGDILLEFDIESDPPELLCDFIGLPHACVRHWRQRNPTMNRFARMVAACVPLAVKRRIPDRMKQSLKILLRAR